MDCKRCKKTINGDDFQGYCESCYEALLNGENDKTDILIETLEKEHLEDNITLDETKITLENNAVASLLKNLSLFLLFVVVIGSIIIMVNLNVFTGVICLFSSTLFLALLYGFGEIIQLLQDIKNNTKDKQ